MNIISQWLVILFWPSVLNVWYLINLSKSNISLFDHRLSFGYSMGFLKGQQRNIKLIRLVGNVKIILDGLSSKKWCLIFLTSNFVSMLLMSVQKLYDIPQNLTCHRSQYSMIILWNCYRPEDNIIFMSIASLL